MNLNVSVPINNLSFGWVSYNILKEMYARGLSPHIFPIGNPDLSSFDRIQQDFVMWLQSCIAKAPRTYKKDYPEFRLWHIQNSEQSHSKNQTLLTFLETDTCTEIEKNTLNNQNNVLVTSSFTRDMMKEHGVSNVSYCALGFDAENYRVIEKHPYDHKCIVFGLMGKFEHARKHTDRVIKLWAKAYGNDPKYRLHLHCFNPFLHQDPAQCAAINAQWLNEALEGQTIWNINPINSYLKTSTEYNSVLNSIDINLDGGGNENFGVPQFTSTALGKHLVTVYSNGVKDWATEENAILVQPSGKKECYDGKFFHKNHVFSQGNFFDFNDEDFVLGMAKAVERYQKNPINKSGLELQKRSWSDCLDTILEKLK